MTKTCPFAKEIASKNTFIDASTNPSGRLGDHECRLTECKFNEAGHLCRINAIFNYQRDTNELVRKLASRLGISV
ncbi:hypothetical protein [Halodesulfovibrio spirochaetisodalis]|uniref:Uncharacterized protein n=1 Tax=Halodesulfovibrio spirochaetisodalis TaxID=1560234 RepID=A0A1B7XAB6_9BACT|nr:hypothetical protein [Halodesulfovibrio spirochaetisodalis]OBQ46230.1 hypothetical protein SP90_13615 [Halodesulfovibrio spirochaetisodalis]